VGDGQAAAPEPQNVPSAVQSEPSPQWAAAVGRARQIVRAVLSEQNLPGLSVAVGVGGDIVWAEGFGWADVETRAPRDAETRFRMGTASTGPHDGGGRRAAREGSGHARRGDSGVRPAVSEEAPGP
jgi:hypothetical protein